MYLERQRLDGRTAFLTGAERGIGLSTAEALAEAGAKVILSGLEENLLSAAVESLKAKGYSANGVVLDITHSQACEEAAERFNREEGSVDILIANAGIAWKNTPCFRAAHAGAQDRRYSRCRLDVRIHF